MKTVAEMNDHEKSVKLAKIFPDWRLSGGLIYLPDGVWQEVGLQSNMVDDLYDVRFFALAWRVLNWAINHPTAHIVRSGIEDWWDLDDRGIYIPLIQSMIPAEAQRAWLDKILELATEAGMVE